MAYKTIMKGEYERLAIDYEPYRERQIEAIVAEEMNEPEDGSTPGHPTDLAAGTGTAKT